MRQNMRENLRKNLRARLNRLQARLNAQGVGLLALAPGMHMRWLLGFHPHRDERPCLLLITPESAGFVTPVLNAQAIAGHCDITLFEWSDGAGTDGGGRANGAKAAINAALRALHATGTRAVALDETMRADHALLLLGHLPAAKHRFTADTLGALRMIKDQDEYTALRENALIADRAMQAGLAALAPDMRESDVIATIRETFAAQGATMAFGICASGPNGAMPHHETGDRRLRAGDAVLLDIGGRKDGFHSDMTRMAIIATPPEGYGDIHAIVEAAVQAALATARPGIPASAVDGAARQVISDAGYGAYFIHRTGHGLGVDIHEPPFISADSSTILQEGMVFSIEPGIYLPGRFGIRLEEIVILRPNGPEILSQLGRAAHRWDNA